MNLQNEALLLDTILGNPDIRFNPLNFVLMAYPWGQPGSPLERFAGPKKWQRGILEKIRVHVDEQHGRYRIDMPPEIFQLAVCSGRGIGKTALLGMITHWFRSCFPGGTCIVSANTEAQLSTRTFPELRKWCTMAINGHWFNASATMIVPTTWFERLVRAPLADGGLAVDCGYYYTKAQLWSEENPDAYAGAHSMIAMMVIFDEASGIPSVIYPVALGYFTDETPYRFWLQFSNGRRTTGGFYESFHPGTEKNPWRTENIDGRDVEGVDQNIYQQIIDKYGLDSDEARVEVKGQFPRVGDRQLIGNDLVMQSMQDADKQDTGAGLMMGVDVARFGSDHTVVRFRQGPDGRSIAPEKWKGLDTVQTADRCAALIAKYRPDAVCIDTALGGAVCDILKKRGYRRIHEINFSSRPMNERYLNRRVEMYFAVKDWLYLGGVLDKDPTLKEDLTSVDYDFNKTTGKVWLEDKDEVRKKIGRSPDDGDALALTFAVSVQRRDPSLERGWHVAGREAQCRGVDYDPLDL